MAVVAAPWGSLTVAPAGFQVPRSVKRTTPAASALASSRPSGLAAKDRTGSVRQPQRANRGLVALEDGEQVAAGLDAIFEGDAGGGEQQGALHRRLAQGERADAFGVGGQRLGLGGGLRPAHQHARGDRRHQQHRGDRQQPSQAPVRPRLPAMFAIGLVDAGIEEGALGRVELGRQFPRGGQPRAAIEIGRHPSACVPQTGGVAELAVHPRARAVLVEPGTQSRPFPDQRFVRDLGGAVVERDEALVREPLQQRVDARR